MIHSAFIGCSNNSSLSSKDNTLFSLDNSTFSNIGIEYSWENWTYEEVSHEINNYLGEKVDEHTLALKSETGKKPVPPGNYPPGVRFGESDWNNYSVDFDICFNGAASFFFIIYDETNLFDSNENDNVQRYWFKISRDGDLTYETTLGTNIEYLYDNGTKLEIKDFNPDLWNHVSIKTINNDIVLFFNSNKIGKIDTYSDNDKGKFAIDGSSGLMIKDLQIYC
jgi:hypothetical protein